MDLRLVKNNDFERWLLIQRTSFLTALTVVATLSLLSLPAAEKAATPVWAMYYAWYETGTGPHAKWTHWSDDPATNAVPKPKSKAVPLIGYYDSDDSAVARWHMQLAKGAGIDAFLMSGGAAQT